MAGPGTTRVINGQVYYYNPDTQQYDIPLNLSGMTGPMGSSLSLQNPSGGAGNKTIAQPGSTFGAAPNTIQSNYQLIDLWGFSDQGEGLVDKAGNNIYGFTGNWAQSRYGISAPLINQGPNKNTAFDANSADTRFIYYDPNTRLWQRLTPEQTSQLPENILNQNSSRYSGESESPGVGLFYNPGTDLFDASPKTIRAYYGQPEYTAEDVIYRPDPGSIYDTYNPYEVFETTDPYTNVATLHSAQYPYIPPEDDHTVVYEEEEEEPIVDDPPPVVDPPYEPPPPPGGNNGGSGEIVVGNYQGGGTRQPANPKTLEELAADMVRWDEDKGQWWAEAQGFGGIAQGFKPVEYDPGQMTLGPGQTQDLVSKEGARQQAVQFLVDFHTDEMKKKYAPDSRFWEGRENLHTGGQGPAEAGLFAGGGGVASMYRDVDSEVTGQGIESFLQRRANTVNKMLAQRAQQQAQLAQQQAMNVPRGTMPVPMHQGGEMAPAVGRPAPAVGRPAPAVGRPGSPGGYDPWSDPYFQQFLKNPQVPQTGGPTPTPAPAVVYEEKDDWVLGGSNVRPSAPPPPIYSPPVPQIDGPYPHVPDFRDTPPDRTYNVGPTVPMPMNQGGDVTITERTVRDPRDNQYVMEERVVRKQMAIDPDMQTGVMSTFYG